MEVASAQIDRTLSMAKKVAEGYPLEYAVGYTSFLGYRFFVNESVLIPRPDTEHLVITAERYIKKQSRVLDLCTGSGCISVTLKIRYPDIAIVALDISSDALGIASKNAQYHLVDVDFVQSDLLNDIKDQFDIIITNPPYIPTDTIKKLEKEISFEPQLALDGGKDGMNFYRKIESSLERNLSDNGILIAEIERQDRRTIPILFEIFSKWSISIDEDLAGKPRVLTVRRKKDG